MATDNAELTRLGATDTHTGSAVVLENSMPDPYSLAVKYGGRAEEQKQRKQAAMAQLGASFGEGWDVDMPVLAQARTQLIKQHADWVKDGKKFNDPATPEWAQSQGIINGTTDLYKASSQQKKYYDVATGELQKNFKEYDVESSKRNLDAYRSLSPWQRDQVNPANLLVPKVASLNEKINQFFQGKKPPTSSSSPVRVGTMYQWYDETGYSPTQMSGFARQLLTDPDVATQVQREYNAQPEEYKKTNTPMDFMVEYMNPYSETSKKLNLQGIPQGTKVNVNTAAGAGNDAEAEDIINRVKRVVNGEGFERIDLKFLPKIGGPATVYRSYDLQGLPIKEANVEQADDSIKKQTLTIDHVDKEGEKYIIVLDNGEEIEMRNKSAYQQIIRPYMQYSGRGEEFKQAVSKMAKKKGILKEDGTEDWDSGSNVFVPGKTNTGSTGVFVPGRKN